jgi:Zn-finger nucleic acid-binding protein
MNCPVCADHPALVTGALEPSLNTHRCPGCGGHWIRLADYWRWRAESGPDLPETPPRPEDATAVHDSRGIKVCPDCRHLMTAYRIGHGIPFTVDRCGHCNGTWLDRDEWTALRARNLHDDLHAFFSDEWQRHLRLDTQRFLTEQQFRRQFGDEDYARIRDLKSWIDAHPRRSELYAYLQVHEQRRQGV